MRKRNALDGLHGKPGPRKQTILTPDYILGPLRRVWGDIHLDPCAPPLGVESRVGATREIRLPDNGLDVPWSDCTFVNPPYRELKKWLTEFRMVHHEVRIAWLIPVRPHRAWWRTWASEFVDTVIYLNPVTFVGYEQTFPTPLCLGYRGEDSDEIVREYSLAGLGEPLE